MFEIIIAELVPSGKLVALCDQKAKGQLAKIFAQCTTKIKSLKQDSH